MNIFAYCAASFKESVRRAAGVGPLLSPPCVADTFDPAWLVGRDFIYFKLHGRPGEIYWYGDDWLTALRLSQIQAADLSGAVVFVANCFGLTDAGEPDVMVQALLDSGARAVVAGPGDNWARYHGVVGPDALGRTMRRLLGFVGPKRAFDAGMVEMRARASRLQLSLFGGDVEDIEAARDTLGFRLLVGG